MVRFATVAAVLALMAAPLVAQESTEQLRKELESLRSEVNGLKADRAQYESKEVAGSAKVSEDSMAPEGDSPLMTLFKNTKLSGFVDAGYEMSFNQLHAHPAGNLGNRARLFDDRDNSFYLNAVQLNLENLASKDRIVGYHLELAAGHDPSIYDNSTVTLQEGWVQFWVPVAAGLDIRVGKMATLVGIEVVESKDDMNYSRGLLFANIQPITHTGVRAALSINDMFSATLGVSNGLNSAGTDTFADGDHGKQLEMNLTVKPNKDALIGLTVLVGNQTDPKSPASSGSTSDKYYLVDIVASYTLDRLTFGLNLDYASAQNVGGPKSPGPDAPRAVFSGVAVYSRFAWTEAMGTALRAEYMSDQNGTKFAPVAGAGDKGRGSRIFEVTLTQEMKIANTAILRVEVRHDDSNHHEFNRNGKAARGDNTLGMEAILPF